MRGATGHCPHQNHNQISSWESQVWDLLDSERLRDNRVCYNEGGEERGEKGI
jgi:hypothetical protein